MATACWMLVNSTELIPMRVRAAVAGGSTVDWMDHIDIFMLLAKTREPFPHWCAFVAVSVDGGEPRMA